MLAIAGGKGGCGKTTTAVGLAAALAREGHAPLVVEADVDMPDLHAVADLAAAPGVTAVAAGDPLEGAARPRPACPGVSVLTGPEADAGTVGDALERCRGWPGPVLVDCPAGVARDVAVPLRAAGRTLLVSTPTPASLRDAAKTAAMARALEAPPVGAVLTRCRTPPDATDLLGCPVLGHVPPAPADPVSPDRLRSAGSAVAEGGDRRNL